MWIRVTNIVNLALLCQLPQVPNISKCFELYGFDILVDSNLRPWLLEVNQSPALMVDCSVDQHIKKPMLHDLFDLVGLPNTMNEFNEWEKLSVDRIHARQYRKQLEVHSITSLYDEREDCDQDSDIDEDVSVASNSKSRLLSLSILSKYLS